MGFCSDEAGIGQVCKVVCGMWNLGRGGDEYEVWLFHVSEGDRVLLYRSKTFLSFKKPFWSVKRHPRAARWVMLPSNLPQALYGVSRADIDQYLACS